MGSDPGNTNEGIRKWGRPEKAANRRCLIEQITSVGNWSVTLLGKLREVGGHPPHRDLAQRVKGPGIYLGYRIWDIGWSHPI